ncbi:MAG: polyphenol oxidase family protein [Elusimicrobiota bacterium]|jgi:hypothetical protein
MPGSEPSIEESSTGIAPEGLWLEPRLRARGVPHGLTLAALGDMKRPARRAEALAAAGRPGLLPCTLLQRHGIRVHEARVGGDYALASGAARLEGDGWVCAAPGLFTAIYVADCLPLFVWDDRDLSVVGVFHAGWRGLAAGMPRAAVGAFERLGVGPERLSAAVGPHAGACCYKVGPELREHFRPSSFRAGGKNLLPAPAAGPSAAGTSRKENDLRLDLGAEAREQFSEAGVDASRVSVSEECTICGRGYHSFRRDKQDLRMMAFIAIPAAPSAGGPSCS